MFETGSRGLLGSPSASAAPTDTEPAWYQALILPKVIAEPLVDMIGRRSISGRRFGRWLLPFLRPDHVELGSELLGLLFRRIPSITSSPCVLAAALSCQVRSPYEWLIARSSTLCVRRSTHCLFWIRLQPRTAKGKTRRRKDRPSTTDIDEAGSRARPDVYAYLQSESWTSPFRPTPGQHRHSVPWARHVPDIHSGGPASTGGRQPHAQKHSARATVRPITGVGGVAGTSRVTPAHRSRQLSSPPSTGSTRQ